jgi:hypothetical protein
MKVHCVICSKLTSTSFYSTVAGTKNAHRTSLSNIDSTTITLMKRSCMIFLLTKDFYIYFALSKNPKTHKISGRHTLVISGHATSRRVALFNEQTKFKLSNLLDRAGVQNGSNVSVRFSSC